MNILVIGAGAIGTLYAGKLSAAGYQVSLLARGERLQQLRNQGVTLHAHGDRYPTRATPRIIDTMNSQDSYDFVLVCVRADQIEYALKPLSTQALNSTVVPMVNHAAGFADWEQHLGSSRLMIGFPGAGASIDDGILRYAVTPRWVQATTLGELSGQTTERLQALAHALRKSGFSVETSNDMDAWQRYHAAYISAFFIGITLAGGDLDQFLRNPGLQRTVFMAIKESFAMLAQQGFKVTPTQLQVFNGLPIGLLVNGLALAGKIKRMRDAFAAASGALAMHEAPVLGAQILAQARQVNAVMENYQRLFEGCVSGPV